MTDLADLERDLRAPKRLTRMRAVRALGRLGGPEATRLLFAVHDDDAEKPVIRNLALDALVQIGTAEVADGLEARLPGYPSLRGEKAVAKKVAKIRQSL